MAKLTDEERRFRKIGAGIPFSRFWAIPLIILVLMLIPSTVPNLFQNCIGYRPEVGGKGGAAILMALSVPCSPYLLREGAWGWTLFAGLWAPVPFAIINALWQKRHRAFWDKVRARERERRRQRREAKKQGDSLGA